MKTFATLETVERRHIFRVIRDQKGNLSKAAQVLGIDRRTLYRKLEKYNQSRRAAIATLNFVGGRYGDNEQVKEIDYVSAYPANLAGAGSTAIELIRARQSSADRPTANELLARSYANELKET